MTLKYGYDVVILYVMHILGERVIWSLHFRDILVWMPVDLFAVGTSLAITSALHTLRRGMSI
ncbi:hypothetical protein SERLA73DRAFT_131608, partial [Serpula lacrymans var. lacrymans S7.3]